MLGFVLYEAVDLIYTVGKMTYNGLHSSYCWYYNIETPSKETTKEKDKVIQDLLRRVEQLENNKHCKSNRIE